jgi:hypothetical protein
VCIICQFILTNISLDSSFIHIHRSHPTDSSTMSFAITEVYSSMGSSLLFRDHCFCKKKISHPGHGSQKRVQKCLVHCTGVCMGIGKASLSPFSVNHLTWRATRATDPDRLCQGPMEPSTYPSTRSCDRAAYVVEVEGKVA